MPAEINYKNKYMELRAKYLNDVDMAFRLGFEQGGQQQQQNQMMEQQQQAQEIEMAAAQGQAQSGPEGAPGEAGPAPHEPGSETGSEHPQGSELDQHIAKLESLVAKSELAKDEDIKKSLQSLVSIRKSELRAIQMRKSEQAIKAISKALHKPTFKLSKQASHNMNSNAKQAVSMQHKLVGDIREKMEAEEKRAASDIKNILGLEELVKG